jgi:hypothetical protein
MFFTTIIKALVLVCVVVIALSFVDTSACNKSEANLIEKQCF